MPAIEGGPAAFRPALGPRNQARGLPADGAAGGARVRCFTRNGHDWADRFPAIVEAALNIKAQPFLIDGEAVVQRDDGTSDFRALRSKHRGREAVLVAFDMIEDDGSDLRDLPVLERKRRLKKLLGRPYRSDRQKAG
jgi:ATP-dependent DNA ligase